MYAAIAISECTVHLFKGGFRQWFSTISIEDTIWIYFIYTSTWTHDIYVKCFSLLRKLAVDYCYNKLKENVIPSSIRNLALNKYKFKKKKTTKLPQIKEHGWVFLLDLLIALWPEKGTPISAGSDLAPFLQVQVIMEGRLFTTFPPQTS